MIKIILSGKPGSGKSLLISEFYTDLGSLMNMKGFQIIKRFDEKDKLKRLDFFRFSRGDILFSVDLSSSAPSLLSQVNPHIEKILDELSIFQMVDIFLFDELGLIETEVKQLQQQIITLFSSRIPVIAAVNSQNLDRIEYLLNRFKIKVLDLDSQDAENIYLLLIRELYDY